MTILILPMVWQKIRKRDGSLVDFDPERIVNAIFKAACAEAESEGKSADRTIAEGLKEKVIEKLKDKIHHNTIPAVEAIQDVVEKEFFEIMSDLEFLPNSPTLMNAGTKVQQLVSCFALKLDDSVSGIFDTLKLAMLIHTSGAGTGYSFSGIRPKGSQISTNKGKASGPVSFLRIFDFATEIIKKGGNRRGANMGVMKVDHPDILEFIHCKDREGDIRNFNVSVGLTNEFMEKVANNDPSPYMCNWKDKKMRLRRIKRDRYDSVKEALEETMTAKELFMEIISSAWKTGEP